MLGDGALTLKEFIMDEPLPLATIHRAVLEWLRDRDDVALFGAQAVNAYVGDPRMTQDVDILSTRAEALVEELRQHVSQLFHIVLRVREVADGRGYRIYQVTKTGNRHLVDVRPVTQLPPTLKVAGLLVVAPHELVAQKVIAWHRRRGRPKSGTDWRDVAVLLLQFPHLKTAHGPVRLRLIEDGADETILAGWETLVSEQIVPEDDDDDFA